MAGQAKDWKSVDRWATNTKLSEAQKILLKRYYNDEKALQSQPQTVFNNIYYASKFGEEIGKPYEQARLEDVRAYLAVLSSQQSKTPKIGLLKFLKWMREPLEEKLRDHEEGLGKALCKTDKQRLVVMRRCVEMIQKSVLRHEGYKQKLPEELLTSEDILKMVQAAKKKRDQAMVTFMYDTGCRASEVCNCQIKHVNWEESHWGETQDGRKVEFVPVFLKSARKGQREVYLTDSVPYLKAWLNEHQRRTDPDSYLFYSGKTMARFGGPNTVGTIIKRIARAAGIKKRTHAHLLRHSRATAMASYLTEQELKLWFGWSGGSKQASNYVHLSLTKLRGSLNRMIGIKDEVKTGSNDTLAERLCTKCGTKNVAGLKFCNACGYPLNASVAVEYEKAVAIANQALLLRIEELERKNEK